MNRKRSGVLLMIAGLVIILLVNALDLFKGERFSFDTAQTLGSCFGLLIVLAGIYCTFTQLPLPTLPHTDLLVPVRWTENFLARCLTWIEIKITAKAFDSIIIAGFALFAVLYTLGRWNGISPFIFIGSDASYISSYAASLDHPGIFNGDYFLGNQGHVASYIALHIPLLRFLNPIVGGYGNAFLVLLPFTIFFKLLGFYLLGKTLLKNRWVALLFTLVTYPIIYTGSWDYWGLLGDVLPRNLFEIAFPWLLLWTITWIDRPRKWYLLSFIMGLLVYVHSISAGTVFVVISFVYLVQSPAPFIKRLGQLLASVGIFTATILPFGLLYLSSAASANTAAVTYEQTVTALMKTFGTTLLNIPGILSDLTGKLWVSGVIVLVLLSLVYLAVTRKKSINRTYGTVALWIMGLLLICIVIPVLEGTLDKWLHLITLRMYLPRGLRFLPPLLLLFSFLVFFDRQKLGTLRFPRLFSSTAVILVVVCLGLLLTKNQQDTYAGDEIRCLVSGHLSCPSQQELDAVDILRALDTYTTPQDRILSVPPLSVRFTPAIRFQSLHMLGFTKGDISRMDDNPIRQAELGELMKPWNALEHADKNTRLQSYIDLAAEMHADYLIVQLDDFTRKSVQQLKPVYQNDHYALIKVGA